MSATDAELAAGLMPTTVTVVNEEHYQDIISGHMPPGWEPHRSWEALVHLRVAAGNPHAQHVGPCIEVYLPTGTVGYFTPKMTERHLPAIAAVPVGSVTASAWAARGTKGAESIWRVKVSIVSRTLR